MKTEAELNQAGDDAIRQGQDLIAYGTKLKEAAQLLASINNGSGVASPVRFKREARMTQGDACEAALRELGKPSSLDAIAKVILDRGMPVKTAEAKNYGPVMSRDERFKSFGTGQWGLVAQEDLSGRGNANGVEMIATPPPRS